jgi:galactose mutarotase-like enzyme
MLEISTKTQKLTAISMGAQVLSWQVLNPTISKFEDVLYTGSSPKRSGIPILFPFANPLDNDIFLQTSQKIGQHGFARNTDWKLQEQTETKLQFSLRSNDISAEMKLAYPFDFVLTLIVDISIENELNYTLEIQNTGNIDLPIAPGLHPYFAVKHNQKASLVIPEIPEFIGNQFDWNRKLNGDFFDFSGIAHISFPDKTIKIDTRSSELDFQHLVVWSQNQNELDHDFVCFEPFSRFTNAINVNPIVIAPNQKIKAEVIFGVEF